MQNMLTHTHTMAEVFPYVCLWKYVMRLFYLDVDLPSFSPPGYRDSLSVRQYQILFLLKGIVQII